jgi:hypothetical protein
MTLDKDRCPSCHRALAEENLFEGVRVIKGARLFGWVLAALWCVAGGVHLLVEAIHRIAR